MDSGRYKPSQMERGLFAFATRAQFKILSHDGPPRLPLAAKDWLHFIEELVSSLHPSHPRLWRRGQSCQAYLRPPLSAQALIMSRKVGNRPANFYTAVCDKMSLKSRGSMDV